ncbi:hypothetical protein UFOVP245_4 [uncultured Caudovirales phage]|uniref:Uncharacterized protein n=1 Tax=uncultured Caudovirales phage TaxID=2100421 RepID=A0A6J7WRJ6_9CAUD|nr:hypothetical protein UFOVP245_4 [uncultured Caudovirales phage]
MRFENPHALTPNTASFTIVTPEPSGWKCYITHNMVLVPDKGKHPNWFHRQMQRLCFGFKWVKDNK